MGVAAAPAAAAVISAIAVVVVAIDDPNITFMGVSCNIFGVKILILTGLMVVTHSHSGFTEWDSNTTGTRVP